MKERSKIAIIVACIATVLLVDAAILGVFLVKGSVQSQGHTLALQVCETFQKGRIQGNIRAERQKLIEEATITSNVKAQRTLKGYTYPKQIDELKAKPPIKTLPPIKCK